MLSLAPGLPDPIVGLAPNRLDVLDDLPPARPEAVLDPAQRLGAEERDADDLAVHIELELFGGRVADPHGPGTLVPGKVIQLELGQAPLAADAVHDLDLRRVARADSQQKVPERECLVGVVGSQ